MKHLIVGQTPTGADKVRGSKQGGRNYAEGGDVGLNHYVRDQTPPVKPPVSVRQALWGKTGQAMSHEVQPPVGGAQPL